MAISENLEALNYLSAWENNLPIAGGIAWEAQLRKCKLDYSWASVQRIDLFLDALKKQVKPTEQQILQRQDTKNLFRLLAYYLAEVRERVIQVPVDWISLEQAIARRPDLAKLGPGFVTSLIADQGVLYAPLAAIWEKLFNENNQLSVALAAAEDIDVPEDLAKPWAKLGPQNWLPDFYQRFQAASISPAHRRWIEAPSLYDIHQDDDLHKISPAISDLLQHGRVVWGALIQANSGLFKPDRMMRAPGEVLYDPEGKLGLADLVELRNKLCELKHQPQTDTDLQFYTQHLLAETSRVFGWKTPPSFNAYPLQASTMMFFSEINFPGFCLALSFFPILVCDQHPGIVMISPWQLWPDDIFEEWCAAVKRDYPNAFVPGRAKIA